jgi:transcriptional regulator
MYVNRLHQLTDREALFSLMASHPLGAWVCHGSAGLSANHVPFLLDRSRGPLGTLLGHVSRANDVWRELGSSVPSVVMFQGPQAYITPNWYPGKAEHGKVVPTWNYMVAHAHGVARVVEDHEWMLDMLQRLTAAHEAGRPTPWRVADAPGPFIEKMMHAVVGIEIPIDRLEGKLKASQDEAMEDRRGTVRGLREEASSEAAAMADLVVSAIEAEFPAERDSQFQVTCTLNGSSAMQG